VKRKAVGKALVDVRRDELEALTAPDRHIDDTFDRASYLTILERIEQQMRERTALAPMPDLLSGAPYALAFILQTQIYLHGRPTLTRWALPTATARLLGKRGRRAILHVLFDFELGAGGRPRQEPLDAEARASIRAERARVRQRVEKIFTDEDGDDALRHQQLLAFAGQYANLTAAGVLANWKGLRRPLQPQKIADAIVGWKRGRGRTMIRRLSRE